MSEIGAAPSDPWDAIIEKYKAHSCHPFTELFAEDMLEGANIGPSSYVLDVATGAGAVALAVLRRGARVLAIDSSAGLVRRLSEAAHRGLTVQQMDGEALKLPDALFDAALSLFGVTLFNDWRAGLREMARVTRKGGYGVVGAWKFRAGGATNLLLTEILRQLFPDSDDLPSPGELTHLGEQQRLSDAMIDAGFGKPTIREVTHPYQLNLSILEDMDRHLEMMPVWATLGHHQKLAVIAEIKRRAEAQRSGETLPIYSTALIASAQRCGG